ncbi:hypothetical protein [Arenimonas composti]|uniref:PepSY domain-containing protein n=1 Tax=Arenimonas composti TR7-09 = DSM 18010 TaxID=1121013 RepID=A0A091BD22_9GAMM|nr:hypothetical protein [Arenimonas composti]KFN50563.1 hypothetical protein P873_05230 [Arenimonas composti TR7-09 = DSM 18010]
MKLKLVDFPGLLALVLIIASASAFAVPSNKWRLEFSGGAESAGEIVLSVTPDGGFPQEVAVAIDSSDGENEVAEKVAEALRAAAGPQYQIERDDGEDVLIKRREGAALFQVSLVRNTVEGVRIGFDPE